MTLPHHLYIQIYAQYLDLDVFRQTLWQLWRAKPLGATANWWGPKRASHVFIPIHMANIFPIHIAPNAFRWWGQGLVSSIPETKVGVVQHSWFPPVSVSHDASQRSCDFAQDIFGKAASSDASEPAGGVAMASQFASLQPVTWTTSKRKTSITGAKVCFLSPNQCQSHNALSFA